MKKHLPMVNAIMLFLVFAWDIENDRDFWTWVWLLNALLWVLIWLKLNINETN